MTAREGRRSPSRRSSPRQRRSRRSSVPGTPIRSASARRRAPAGAPRTPRRTCRHRGRPRSSGSSATCTGMPVSWRSRSSRPRSRAPPPVSTMPRSMMSPASSGGVWSRVARTASTIACSGSSRAWRTSALETTTVRGRPETMSRPRISASGSSGSGNAEPRVILTSSAVRSPSIRRVLLLHPGHDRLVEVVARGADRQRGDDPAQRDDGDLGGAAAHVDDHVAGGLVHGQPGADRGRHRLLDDVDPAGAGLVAGLLDGALLDRGDPAGDADRPSAAWRSSGGGAPAG